MKRIQRLLDPKPATAVWTPLLAAIVLLITSAVAFAAWPARARQQSSAAEQQEKARSDEQQEQAQRDEQLEKAQRDEQQQKVRDENSPYQKWLNQEVVYIITPEERAAFEKLTTDDERQKFVEQFWERRNPHPGSPVNTYKQQYYHRLAYANEHFATPTRPGWQSDRGHMLLVYGPPDEIDAHPANKPFPYEEWMYRHVEGLGDNVTLTFIDRSHSGDYQLAPGPVNKHSSEQDSAQPTFSSNNGYSAPACLHCPLPQYTSEALAHNFQGAALVIAVVTPGGRAEDIKAVKKLPYGLTEKAIEAVETWRFRPALGPDGKPAAVRQPIEVGFHLY